MMTMVVVAMTTMLAGTEGKHKIQLKAAVEGMVVMPMVTAMTTGKKTNKSGSERNGSGSSNVPRGDWKIMTEL